MKNFPKNLVLAICWRILYEINCKDLFYMLSPLLCFSEFWGDFFFFPQALFLLIPPFWNQSPAFIPNRNTVQALSLYKKKI